MNGSEHSSSPNPSGSRVLSGLALAVNSHGWEDFPSHHLGSEAAEILAGWTALWHPVLLEEAKTVPVWHRIDQWPDEPTGFLLVVPGFSMDLLPDGTANRLADCGGFLVQSEPVRSDLLQNLLAQTNVTNLGDEPVFGDAVVADFFSLGYCYLQIQLMTRQLRFTSNLDEDRFGEAVLEAVNTARDADPDRYEPAIQNCFDQLREERNRYYPTTANLIDYVLLTRQTLGSRFEETLRQRNSFSVQASGSTLEAIMQRPGLKPEMKKRIDDKRLSIAGGEMFELPAVLLSTWTSVRQFQRGCRLMDEFSREPRIYGRRSFGLRLGLPAVLEHFDFRGVVHCTLDDGVFPQTSGNHIRWEGNDATTLDALVSPPALAAAPETWLNLGVRIGEVIDLSHYATMLLVHWPGDVCEYYHDLINSSRFGDILGEFITLNQYFEQAGDPGYTQRYAADDYRDPWLNQLVSAGFTNPVSRFQEYWKTQVPLMQESGFLAMQSATGLSSAQDSEIDRLTTLKNRLSDCQDQIDERLHCFDSDKAASEQTSSSRPAMLSTEVFQDQKSYVTFFNPFSFTRRQTVAIDRVDPDHPSVLIANDSKAVIEVPPLGYVCLKRGADGRRRPQKKTPDMAGGNFLRNDYFEVEIDEATGGIGAIKFYGRRTNMLAQQLALRQTDTRQSRSGRRDAIYSRMVVDSLQVTVNDGVEGQITTSGSLVMDQKPVARFSQTATATRFSPVLKLEIELEPSVPLNGNPWHNYFASRFAWDDETATLHAWQNESRHTLVRQRMVAPMAIEIDHQHFQTSLLTCGLPFHQKTGYRHLDSLLNVAGETQTRFRMGIGINLPYPYQAALGMMSELPEYQGRSETLSADHAWLFHLNCKNVLALNWQPVQDADSGRSGVRVLLKETEGRRASLDIRCCRDLKIARVVRASTNPENSVDVDRQLVIDGQDDACKATLEMAAHEMVFVELFW